jgi:RND family efflux transporter MFP subunit
MFKEWTMFREILQPIALAGITVLAVSCVREAPAGQDVPTLEREPVPVSLAQVSREKVARPVRGVGRVAAADELRQGFALGGRVLQIYVDEGDHVKRGQLIARLDVREIDAQVRQAEAAASKAERDLARVTGLHAERVVADEMFQNATTGADVARAARDAAHEARRNAALHASADGLVLRRLVESGEVVGAGMPVVVLGGGDSGPIVRVGLSDRDATRIRVNDAATVTLRALPGQHLAGRVRQLAPTADPRTGTIEAEIALDLPNAALVPGVVAAVEITPSLTDEVDLVPVAAIVDADGDRAAVFVLDASGRARRQPVRVAFISGDRVALREGPGGAVVADGAAYLDEGAPAKVVEAKPVKP